MGQMGALKTDTEQKYQRLKQQLREMERVMVAFSGGVDSTFLLKTAYDVLGENAVAITANSPCFLKREGEEAEEFCRREGIRHISFPSEELELEEFCQNPPERCYICKRQLFLKIQKIAKEEGGYEILEGSNMDDTGDYRPGLKAVKELGIRSPLKENGLYKDEIRRLSQRQQLPTWDKPSFACLASRFAYGERITKEKLEMVEQAEEFLRGMDLRQVRVRIHGTLARIEVPLPEIDIVLRESTRERIVNTLKQLGFDYVTVDMQGYRTGSMNEVLEWKREN